MNLLILIKAGFCWRHNVPRKSCLIFRRCCLQLSSQPLSDAESKLKIEAKKTELCVKAMEAQFMHIETQTQSVFGEVAKAMSNFKRERAEEQKESARMHCLVVNGVGQELPKAMIERMCSGSSLVLLDMGSACEATASYALESVLRTCVRNTCLDCVIIIGLPVSPSTSTEVFTKVLSWAASHSFAARQLICQGDFNTVHCQSWICLGASEGGVPEGLLFGLPQIRIFGPNKYMECCLLDS